MLSLLGTTLLVVEASDQRNPWKIVSFSVYGASLVFLFAMSALHHGIEGSPRLEKFLRMMDYLAIYPLIAGTLTPLCLVYFHGSVIGWAFLGVVWLIAILGMFATSLLFPRIPKWVRGVTLTVLTVKYTLCHDRAWTNGDALL
jgi:hemolysin III